LKKALLSTLLFCTLASSVFAAPFAKGTAPTPEEAPPVPMAIHGNGSLIYYSDKIFDASLTGSLSDRWGVNFNLLYKSGDTGITAAEIGIQYAFTDQFALTAGGVDGHNVTTAADNTLRLKHYYGGFIYNQPISDEQTAYVMYLKGPTLKDLKVGTTFNLSDALYLEVAYRDYKYNAADYSKAFNGVGAGLGFKF